jgi:hypothetical protein
MKILMAIAAALACCGAFAAQQSDDKERITINVPDNHVFCRYHYANVTHKPYIQELFSPAGFNVLRDNVPDHIHHHGLMFAVAVDGVDFWSETAKCGKQVHDKFLGDKDSITENLHWVSSDNKVLLQETRGIHCSTNGQCNILEWTSYLELPADKESAELTGAHYFGLGMRFPESMDGIGEFFNASGKPGEIVRGEERNVEATWCAYTAAPEGKPVTVAMFAHKSNPRPTTWFTMPRTFAYMSATLNLHKEPMKIEPKKPLMLRYAVVVWDKKATPEEINAMYKEWKPVRPYVP